MEGITNMRNAKGRTIERKRRRKATSATRTDKSRAKRLANKAKRAEIIAINPYVKINIIDQETYVDGIKVEILDSKIVPVNDTVVPDYEDAVVEYQEVMDKERIKSNGAIGKEVKEPSQSKFRKFLNKYGGK